MHNQEQKILYDELQIWRQFIEKYILEAASKFLQPNSKVLDIGIGDSSVFLKRHFPHIKVLDKRAAPGVDYVFDIQQSLTQSNDYFNYNGVFLLEVLEHTENPFFVAENIKHILINNGYLFVSVPCFLFHHPGGDYYGDYWRFLPGHINHLFLNWKIKFEKICEHKLGKPLGMLYVLEK